MPLFDTSVTFPVQMDDKSDGDWEERFVAKNQDIMKQTIRLFVSKRGIFLFMLSLNLELLLFRVLATSRFTSAVVFVSIQYVYAVLLFSLPEPIFNLIYPESLADVNHATLIRHAKAFHTLIGILHNIHRSFFVNWDVFSVSCFSAATFGVLLLVRAMPVYLLAYIFVLISISLTSYLIHRNNTPTD